MDRRARPSVIRERSLIKLKDQLGYFRLPVKSIKGAERSRHLEYIANNFLNINKKSFDALEITSSISFNHDIVSIDLRSNGVIGAAPLFASETRKVIGGIIVEPKFGWNDIGPLLNCIGWAASPQLINLPMIPGSAKEIPPWVLAGPIVERIAVLLKNINRGFSFVREIRESPRGRILWQEYISKSYVYGKSNKIPCQFPDLNQNDVLRSYIKWGLEEVKKSLLNVQGFDETTVNLIGKIEFLLNLIRDVPSKIPSSNSLNQILRDNSIPSIQFLNGLQAITWIREERGLAGQREPDGLAWNMKMSDLFEKWVEAVITIWARKFGGIITSSRKDTSRVAIHWENSSLKSLSNLIPDVVVETNDTVYIFDAKYKKLYEELDDQKWRELSHELQEEHRHDLHQVLAYASLYNKPRIVSILAYPLTDDTYTRLSNRSRLLNRAHISIENKTLEIGIFGLPLTVNHEYSINDIATQLNPLSNPLSV
jgi:5-methylcytosine-specific restriction endonuclease McrBC regulatory subunit McrC